MYQYQARIIAIGDYARDALDDNMMILFGHQAPEEVRDYCFVHSGGELTGELSLDSTLLIGEVAYIVTAVGPVANHNLATLGHITLKFDGQMTPELPGTVHLLGPAIPDITAGETLLFG